MTLDEILKEIKKAESFVILAHENPDGDAVSSTIGMANALKSMGKENIDVLFKEYPAKFNMLPNTNYIKTEATREKYDMAIVLDCSELKRVSSCYHEYFENAKVTVEIDHHLKNAMFADYNVVNPVAPATAQILVSSFQYMNIEINTDIATCLLTGIITDTGGFRYNSTTTETFEFAGWALAKGVNVSKIYKEAMMTKRKPQFEAEKLAIDRLEFFADSKITFTYITKKDEKALGVEPGETDGIAGIGITIKDVEIAIFAHERENGYKLSFRSNRLDVSEICMLFGGGGHKLAAGCTIDAKLEDVKKAVIEETIKHLD